MSKINFVSHEQFPNDEYTKELVYLELNVPARVAFVRKSAKSGGFFWSVANIAVVQKNGQKEYYPAYMQDSNFLEKDIKNYLDNRKWESENSVHKNSDSTNNSEKPKSMSEVAEMDQLPF